MRRTALPLAVLVAAVVAACGGDDTGGGGGSSGTQPSACATPCSPGALCYQPAPGSLCNGDWYCWDDATWHCAPPDSGGPGDATVTFETGASDATTGAGDGEAGAD